MGYRLENGIPNFLICLLVFRSLAFLCRPDKTVHTVPDERNHDRAHTDDLGDDAADAACDNIVEQPERGDKGNLRKTDMLAVVAPENRGFHNLRCRCQQRHDHRKDRTADHRAAFAEGYDTAEQIQSLHEEQPAPLVPFFTARQNRTAQEIDRVERTCREVAEHDEVDGKQRTADALGQEQPTVVLHLIGEDVESRRKNTDDLGCDVKHDVLP